MTLKEIPSIPQAPKHRPLVVSPHEGLSLWSGSDLATLKVHAAATGGAFSLHELTCVPGGGPPPHQHAREDEMFYVLGGAFTFIYEDVTFTGYPGTAVYVPRHVTHTIRNASDRPATALVWAGSANFERFMLAVGVPRDQHPTPPPVDAAMIARLTAACEAHGIRLLPGHQPTRTVDAPPSAGGKLSVLGSDVTLALVGATTGGRLCVADVTVPPGGGPPPHRHGCEDEVIYVLSGTFEVLIGSQWHPLPTGATAYVPKGTVHTFRNVGDTPGRLFDLHTPAGFEHFFIEGSRLGVAGAPVDQSAFERFFAKHGMEVA